MTETVAVCLPEAQVEALNMLVKLGVFRSRSEAVREAIRRLIEAYREILALFTREVQGLNTSASRGLRAHGRLNR